MPNQKQRTLNGEQALRRLMAGNERYVKSRLRHPHQTTKRRIDLKEGQHPFAVILGCSDSRVPPEVIFDLGLGDLFVVRVAGNIIDDIILGSIEYAAAHLNTPLIMVLGHSKCGAVEATLDGNDLEGHIPALAAAIQPAMDSTKERKDDAVNNTAKANAKMVSEQIKQSEPILSDLVDKGRLTVISAFYNIDSGDVEIL